MENKCPDETLHVREMNLNLWILRMLEETFSLGTAYFLRGEGSKCLLLHLCAQNNVMNVYLLIKGVQLVLFFSSGCQCVKCLP